MGCAVNGIGECRNANFGIYGNKTHCFVYKNGKFIKQVPHSEATHEFQKLLLK
jgi:4-hydroxy-3-methylbut-2-en-1-yl diphosphate synthase IspG/GcpE